MASLLKSKNIEISIPAVEIEDKITNYVICVQLEDIIWRVVHRYSSFANLHQHLVLNCGISRELLPPKKLIGNKDPNFINKRKSDLESYLQTVVTFLSAAMPIELAEFLDLQHYEVTYLLQNLAKHYFQEGDKLVLCNSPATFNPLQLMAISEQLKAPHPIHLAAEGEADFSHVADFCSNVKHLIIGGGFSTYKSSNIVLNSLPFTLNIFKNIEILKFHSSDVSQVEQLGNARKSVRSLFVNKCQIKRLSEILLCDILHQEEEKYSEENCWSEMREMDVSCNHIANIDASIHLLPKVERLNLGSNFLKDISYLSKLPHLVSLNLSNNAFTILEDLHTKLGNITELNLSQNKLSSLDGFSKMYSIVTLNLSCNCIEKLSCVSSISCLPCLEYVLLTGNPLATVVDYRTRVLELFDKRACEICLDNERPTAKELDKVAVLQALRTAKEGRLPTLTIGPLVNNSTLITIKPDEATIARE